MQGISDVKTAVIHLTVEFSSVSYHYVVPLCSMYKPVSQNSTCANANLTLKPLSATFSLAFLFLFLKPQIFQTKQSTKEGNTITAAVIVACYVGNKRPLNWGLIV